MPNTVVKLINAESTWLEAAWEDRKLLIKKERDTQKCVSLFVVSVWEEGWQQDIPSAPVCGLKDRGAGFLIYKGKEKSISYRKEHTKKAPRVRRLFFISGTG